MKIQNAFEARKIFEDMPTPKTTDCNLCARMLTIVEAESTVPERKNKYLKQVDF